MPGQFARSWELTKHTFHVMKQDKEILLFPVLSSIFSIILFLIFALPWFIGDTFSSDKFGILLYVGIFVFYFVVTFSAVFFNVATVHVARTRFEGGDATFVEGLRESFRHIVHIIGWSLLSATVGVVLNILSSHARKQGGIGRIVAQIAVSLVGMAWAIVSVFVVPAMVIQGLGPIDALKSSTAALKKTWGESLIRHYGLGLVQFAFMAIGVVLLLIPGIFLFVAAGWIGFVLIGIFILYFMLVAVIFSAANTVFNTAIYLYATTGKVPSAYPSEQVKEVFTFQPETKGFMGGFVK